MQYQSPLVEVDARQCLLIAEEKRLMARVELRRTQLRDEIRRDSTGFHECERLPDAGRQRAIPSARRRSFNEIKRPAMHIVKIGVTSRRESAQEVKCGGGLTIGLKQAFGIGRSPCNIEFQAVDIITPVRLKRNRSLRLRLFGARLGELTGNAADFHHRHSGSESQHHRHLQDDPERVADIIGMKFGEAFRTIAALEQESLPRRNLPK